MNSLRTLAVALALALALPFGLPAQQTISDRELRRLLDEVTADVEANRKLTQVIVDKIFSFGELGFQEVETSRYLTGLLRENGFEVAESVSGIPTAWFARWGTGEPVIAFGSDIDGIPKSSQKPGVPWHDPIVEGAPGHGEGHNAGQAVNVTAALALKRIMEREGIAGTLILWPGVAEELVASKAWFVRDGLFADVDAVFFTHVSNSLSVSWGAASGTGLVSAEFTFEGEAAHGAGSPWRGRSALDAVELMNTAWNFRREHLHPDQRSHYVISDGGDQPNVVPSRASVWYYVRQIDAPDIRRNFETLIRISEGAAMMTDTEVSHRILGTAYPRHFNRTIAETMQKHIEAVGMPEWSEADQTFAKAVQKELGSREAGLNTRIDSLQGPGRRSSGGSDDIGDVSWVVPTVTLRFPSNIPGTTGHHWSAAIAMATPVAHRGATAGAKVMARTALEFFARPRLVEQAWTYFRDVQTKETKYEPFITENDPPPIHLNARIMQEFAPKLKPFYYDETRFDTYLEQLGITYPTTRR